MIHVPMGVGPEHELTTMPRRKTEGKENQDRGDHPSKRVLLASSGCLCHQCRVAVSSSSGRTCLHLANYPPRSEMLQSQCPTKPPKYWICNIPDSVLNMRYSLGHSNCTLSEESQILTALISFALWTANCLEKLHELQKLVKQCVIKWCRILPGSYYWL